MIVPGIQYKRGLQKALVLQNISTSSTHFKMCVAVAVATHSVNGQQKALQSKCICYRITKCVGVTKNAVLQAI